MILLDTNVVSEPLKPVPNPAVLACERVLPFDTRAANAYAALRARARVAGFAIGLADTYIAAIAAAHRFTIATRDTKPFQICGLDVVDPWLLKQ